MRTGQAQVVRDDWYDRNISSEGLSYSATHGGHATSLRATYTVPADRVAVVEAVHMNIIRTVGAGDTFSKGCHTDFVISGGLKVIRFSHYANCAADFHPPGFVTSCNQHLVAGDVINLYTDAAGSMTLRFTLAVLITEYDA